MKPAAYRGTWGWILRQRPGRVGWCRPRSGYARHGSGSEHQGADNQTLALSVATPLPPLHKKFRNCNFFMQTRHTVILYLIVADPDPWIQIRILNKDPIHIINKKKKRIDKITKIHRSNLDFLHLPLFLYSFLSFFWKKYPLKVLSFKTDNVTM